MKYVITLALLMANTAQADSHATFTDKHNAAISQYLKTIISNPTEREAFDNSLGDTVMEGDECDALSSKGKLTKRCKRAIKAQLVIERSVH